ncbi:MAG: DUF11 domain-containing protein, partial [Blastocatellia bacterium]|nr:DUF11 domain-containing protein [Blastocatellia bacterium]
VGSGAASNGLSVMGGSTTIRGFVINRFTNHGIVCIGNGSNLIEGNFIGTNVDGNAVLGNLTGVFLSGTSANSTVGGTTAGARNVISGNTESQVRLHSSIMTTNIIQGNFIGTDANGTAALNNPGDGIFIVSSNNTIGGTTAGARNIVSGNGEGILMRGELDSVVGNLVQGNYVGTNSSGLAALGNTGNGVSLFFSASNNTVGGTSPAARNIISGNGVAGVAMCTCFIGNATGNLVQGNYIGTNVSGNAALGNGQNGVGIQISPLNTIGGTTAGARNIISGNGNFGVSMSGRNFLQGNFIGTDVTGTKPIGNGGSGVFVVGGFNNRIGGTDAGAGNIIAFNGGNGVEIEPNSGSGTSILSNSVFSNNGLGIDLGIDGVTPNDACDADAGPNNTQNFPVIESVSSFTIQGSLTSTPNTTFTIQLFSNTSCDESGFGEGQTFLGSGQVTTDANCIARFSFITSVPPDSFITATATDPNGNTSEFSPCTQTGTSPADVSIIQVGTPDPVLPGGNITYTMTVTNNGPGVAKNITLTNPVPLNTTFQSLVAPPAWTCSTPQEGSTGLVNCTMTSLDPNASSAFVMVVKVNPDAPAGTIITNATNVFGSTDDPNAINNIARTMTTVTNETPNLTDLSLAITGSPDTVAAGQQITYTFTASNAGPDIAHGVGVIALIPEETSLASVSTSQGTFNVPPIGDRRLIAFSLGQISAGGSVTMTVVANVLAVSGSTLRASGLSTTTTLDPNLDNNASSVETQVRGGGFFELSWDQPPSTPDDPTPAPANVRAGIAILVSDTLPIPGLFSWAGRINNESLISGKGIFPLEDGPCTLVQVNIYKSEQQPVAAIPENLWKVVSPDELKTTMTVAPAGSFYALTSVWDCNGMMMESSRSNQLAIPAGPTIDEVTLTGKLKATGSGFARGLEVFIDGVGFEKQAKVKKNNTLVKQKGKLTDGRTLAEAVTSGQAVLISFRNPDGGISSLIFLRE